MICFGFLCLNKRPSHLRVYGLTFGAVESRVAAPRPKARTPERHIAVRSYWH